MNNALITTEIVGKIARITLNRPEKRNALNPEMIAGLTSAFQEIKTNEIVRVVILKANGGVFSAGADLEYLKQLLQNTHEQQVADSASLKEMFYTVWSCEKIVIAQVEGAAIAGGCGLVSVCDFVFSVPEANFGYTEVKIGFIPALVACFLTDRIGGARTREMLLSGEMIPAKTAFEYGLVNFLSQPGNIASEVNAYAEKLSDTTSPESITRTKKLLHVLRDQSLEESLKLAIRENAESRETDDFKKGITAFLAKQKISW